MQKLLQTNPCEYIKTILCHGLNKFLPILSWDPSKFFYLGLNKFALDVIKGKIIFNIFCLCLKFEC